MLDVLPYFYQGRASDLDALAASYRNSGALDALFLDNLKGLTFVGEEITAREYFSALRSLIDFAILAQNHNQQKTYCCRIAALLHELRRQPLWSQCQLSTALDAFVALLVGEHTSAVVPCTYESGAASLEFGGHWLWGEIPHNAMHAELGALWAALGLMTGNADLVNAAHRLAQWHINTIGHDTIPLPGVFSQEPDGSVLTIMQNDYMLFHTVALASQDGTMEAYALNILAAIKEEDPIFDMSRGSHSFIVAAWADAFAEAPSPQNVSLPHHFRDDDLLFAGVRTKNVTVVSTARGGATGLGAYRFKDVEIVTFGPHHLPLGDTERFGVMEGKGAVLTTDDGFTVHGTLALVPYYIDGEALVAKKWIEVVQTVKDTALTIDATLLNLFHADEISFVFYIKAHNCRISAITLLPQSLERYEGPSSPITFIGVEGRITIDLEKQGAKMQVIPLAGNESFWGATFLVAYSIVPHTAPYSWKIIHSD